MSGNDRKSSTLCNKSFSKQLDYDYDYEMNNTTSTRVVSMCSLGHKDVWRLTSDLLPRFIQADEYIVYVPQNEIEFFREVSNSLITVKSQESLDIGFGDLLLKEIEKTSNEGRFGWYLQQLYKIEALIESPSSATIIWDSDCVPTKSVQLFNKEFQPIYMKAAERHQAYFEMIDRFLGLPNVQNQSFVVPGFPMLNSWVKEFVEYVENRHPGKAWFEALIHDTDLSLKSGFSETETLGTWVANSYPQKWHSIDLKWERYGQSRFNYARNLSLENVIELGRSHDLDIISFENWDSRGIRRVAKLSVNFFVKFFVNVSKYRLTKASNGISRNS